MLNLADISSRVYRGVATSQDTIALLTEVQRLYGQPTPPEALALELAQAGESAAIAASQRAQASLLLAQHEAQVTAQNAATAKAVADAAAKAVADKAAKDKAAANQASAAAILSQKQAVANSLKEQLDA
jgi:colicin import membrane protein